MPEDEDAYELGWWIVSALRRRGDLESSLRMRLDRLPDAALPWRPLEGARSIVVDRLVRYRCEFAVRPGADPKRARETLSRLKPNIHRLLHEEDILGGRYDWGLAEGKPEFGESDDGRFLICSFEIALDTAS